MAETPDPIKALFAAAVALPPAERAAFLERQCAGDPSMRQRLEALLRAHERAGHLLDRPAAADDAGPTAAYVPSAEVGTIIAGRYKLLEEIGEGGMGDVWVAEQIEPVKRKVALKLIKLGMDSRSVLARFEAERQALALMDHPHIAKVLDGGLTETGRLFFVMEYVKGVPITEYCDAAQLGIAERLGLFVAVCKAVQHAHQKGIIHLDLKPSNILVAPYDGAPVPKVIDFGLAKAVHQPLTERTLHTAHETILGTPLYMSPEQAQLNNLDVDTRTDIYSLGVLLYELLTGTTPLEKRRFKEAAWEEVRRILREEEPPRPSARLSSTDTLPSVAACRQSEPARLTRLVRGELDWIVMKALAKERSRRYESASGLARDLERYLSDEPVEARPPSARYWLGKFFKRHRGPVLAAAVVLLALVAGIVGTTWGLVRADRARREAVAAQQAEAERAEGERQAREQAQAAEQLAAQRLRQVEEEQKQTELQKQRAEANARQAREEKRVADAVRDFLQTKLLGQADTRTQADALLQRGGFAAAADRNVTVRELLDRAAAELTPEKIEANFHDQPLLQAELLHTVGNACRGVGETAQALAFLQRAAALCQQGLGPDHLKTLVTLNDLAVAYRDAGKLPEAIRLFEQVSDGLVKKEGPDNPNTLTTLNNLALTYLDIGRPREAIRLFEQVRDAQVKKLGPDHPATLNTLNNLASAYQAAGKLPEAIRLFEQVREGEVKKLGPDHPDTLNTLNNLASAYQTGEKLPGAIQLFEQVRDTKVKKLGPDHPYTLKTLINLAGAYQDAGKLPEAIQLLEQVRDAAVRKLGPDHPDTLTALNNLALLYKDAGKLPEAIRLGEQVRDARVKQLDPDHPDTLTTLNNLAGAYQDAGKLPEAIRLLEQVRDARVRQLGRDHPDTLTTLGNLGVAYWSAKQLSKSIPLFEDTLRRRQAILGREHHDTLGSIANLGVNYRDAGRLDEALPLLEEAYSKGKQHADLAWVGGKLCGAYIRAGKTKEAVKLTEDLLAGARRRFKAGSPELANELVSRGWDLLGLKQHAAAEPILRECLTLREKLMVDKQVAPWQVANAKSLLGGALLGKKKYAEGEPLLQAGYEGLKQDEKAIPPESKINIAAALGRLIDLYDATGRKDEAAKRRQELENLRAAEKKAGG
jgi:eukaryotic-like serine/threonine-protein kinase